MAGAVKNFFVDKVARNLRNPYNGLIGTLALRWMVRKNRVVEENAVRLCQLKPDHNVLEIGFGPGLGLAKAYEAVKDGKGKVYGIDTSQLVVQRASKLFKHQIKQKRMLLFHGTASAIPLNTDSVHRVFHSNCYYFWPAMRPVMREIYRVLQPGGMMVTTINLTGVRMAQQKGFLKYGNPDPVKYMTCLENYGFENVHLEYLRDEETGQSYQAIFAEVLEKPAHEAMMLSDDENDETEKEVETLLKAKEEYRHFTKAKHK